MSAITYFDDADGTRIALSAAEVGTWSAAVASLLTSECGLSAGGRVGVLLPPHWQTAVVLLGAWSARMEVSFQGWGAAGLSSPVAGRPLDATFVESRRVGSWLDDVPAGRHQFALFGSPPPDGYRDFVASVRGHLGADAPAWAVDGREVAASGGVTFGEYGALAVEVARSRGIARGDRVLIDVSASDEPLFWLMGPLSVGASVVLCANLDPARVPARVAVEGVTKVFAPSSVRRSNEDDHAMEAGRPGR
jgi:uncharacterized protein (TIGR03089 family)